MVRLLLLAALGGAVIFLTASPENVRFVVGGHRSVTALASWQ